jgi:hypothetical protein
VLDPQSHEKGKKGREKTRIEISLNGIHKRKKDT